MNDKSNQTLSKETNILAFNGRSVYIFKTFKDAREFNGYIYPQQNGFSSPLSWRTQAYKIECGRR